MEELQFRITNIKIITEDEIEITINVWDKNEITTILENLSTEDETNEKIMKVKSYSFTICPITYTMTHCEECELEECFGVYSKYEDSDNLNPRLRRQWKTANIVDNLTSLFFKRNYFKKLIWSFIRPRIAVMIWIPDKFSVFPNQCIVNTPGVNCNSRYFMSGRDSFSYSGFDFRKQGFNIPEEGTVFLNGTVGKSVHL